MIIDTHIHLYDPHRPEGAPWPEPEDEVIYMTTLPGRCIERAKPVGVDGAIVVECSEWVEDNQWVLDLADNEPFILGLVGNLDIHDGKFSEHLDRFSKHPVFRGIRARLWKPDDMAGLRKLSDLDLSLDVGLNELTLKIATEIPELRIVINHCAGIHMDGDESDPAAVDLMRRAADHPNVFCKLSGMMDLRCTIRPAPTDVAHYAPYLDLLWDAFGEDRTIFGSDWPVSDRSDRSYSEVLKLAQEYVATKPASTEAKVFSENARRAYKWKDRS
jgi:L-fuconolactonase